MSSLLCTKCSNVFDNETDLNLHKANFAECISNLNKNSSTSSTELLNSADLNINKSENYIYNVENKEGLLYLHNIPDNAVNLILTDPPYIISKDTGMNKLHNDIKNDTCKKTEMEWTEYKSKNNITTDADKEKYINYGSTYGKKYSIQTDYGEWDTSFTMEILENFIKEYYRVLKTGGTLIIFFDIWKISYIKNMLDKYNFKQIRFIEWIKTNPQPRNSKINYLTNCREIAIVSIKNSNPVFNSEYDNGIYYYPLQGGKNRVHPTQKNLDLFKELIKKHSVKGDVVLDTFLGSGTTLFASIECERSFYGCEISPVYYEHIQNRFKKYNKL